MALHYSTRQEKHSGSRKVIRQMLALIPALAIAVACYSVSVYAWFQVSIVNSGNVIQATTYVVEVKITEDDNKEIEAADGGYSLEAGTEYKVILTAAGGGEKGGYCVIQPQNGEPLYTAPIKPKEELTFTLIPDKAQTYTFTAVWGEYSGVEEIIENNGVIGTNPTTQAAPTDDTGSSEPVETTAPEQPVDSEPAETATPEQPTTSQPTEATESITSALPTTSEPATGASSAVTSEPQSSEPAAPDTTSSQATEPKNTDESNRIVSTHGR